MDDSIQNDAYYSTLDAIITVIDRKMPTNVDIDQLERLLDEVLFHFKCKNN